MPHGYGARFTGFIDIYTIEPGSEERHGAIRCVHFNRFVFAKIANANRQAALRDAELRNLIVEIEQAHFGEGADSHRCPADLQLGAGQVVGPDVVAGRNRIVEGRGTPLVQ
jgi:hypothetical protein